MSGHTPTPWEAAGSMIYAPGRHGANICAMSEPRASKLVGYTPLWLGSHDGAEAWANRDLIVRAVNAHGELVAALRGLLASRSVNTLEDAAREYPHGKEDVADIVAAFDNARAALARATGEPADPLAGIELGGPL